MKLVFASLAWADYLFWQENDPPIHRRVNALIKDATRSPFSGIGKPEPLAGNLKGWWSRRITREHRLVYRLTGTGPDQAIEIAMCRFHYGA
ncbi:Txe/YoeB family addiction module toxin [Microvirga brassicacearum]|uniref:Putative mRNA interferase YoeB n=1 Tax=Microvirga brassicacearum TaxID=2580413 RepID=A0A5N3PIF2_9HYPH|nr:Txe/YoeB family addiction module toxin [Microvirga brassicacearum]KAB0269494.1 Txe/YoeB family addiction module toxin [Microvirga brassicacearum]